ncbi:hypothetical protein GF327_02245 [Candidatus Woesearchaeota archaeon]|nr:hypothetical protein [Candidatus Woesearchaeota archaeon]
MKKKSQTEIFGLVIIVIILIMGVVFLVGSRLNKKEQTDSGVSESKYSQNLLGSILSTDTQAGLSISDCIQDIVKTDNKCTDESFDSSFDYTRFEIEKILEKTLNKRKKEYTLLITKKSGENIKSAIDSSKEFLPIKNGNCNSLQEKEAPGIMFLPAHETLVIKLEVCK